MFRDVKTNQTIYILNRSEMVVTENKVIAVSVPHLDMSNGIGGVGQMLIDITIDQYGKSKVYSIPDNLSVTYSNDSVISCDKMNLIREVEQIKQQSQSIIESMEQNKKTIEKADAILAKYSPLFKEKKDTDERFGRMEDSIEELKKMIVKLTSKQV